MSSRLAITNRSLPEQESVTLLTTTSTALHQTPELGLVPEEIMIRPTRVETMLLPGFFQIMAKCISKQWGISWCSEPAGTCSNKVTMATAMAFKNATTVN